MTTPLNLPLHLRRWLLALAIGMGLLAPPAGAAPPIALQQTAVDTAQLLRQLYPEDGQALLWRDKALMNQALALLRDAASHGLDPAIYATEELALRLEQAAPEEAAAADRALSQAMLQLLAHLHVGRVTPDIDLPSPAERLRQFDLAARLRAALDAGDLEQAVQAAIPRHFMYQRLRDALQHYRRLASEAQPFTAPRGLPKNGALTPGAAVDGLASVQERLALLGDLATSAPPQDVDSQALEDALKQFQSRHGLAENGRLNRETLAALGIPLSQRVRELALTLERLRWMPPLRPGRIIAVNVPTFRLWAFDSSAGAAPAALEMRVIVGKAARTQTPLFIGQMRYLEFNPYWNVPPSIARNEIAPKLARNPGYLAQQRMELVAPTGQVQHSANPAAALRAGTMRVRQRPGSHNVLGAVKFAMPNPMNIYLHSTSAQELFDKTRRDLSHGCIRVEQPAALARFVLSDQPAWSAPAIEAAMKPGRTQTVRLSEPIPVVLFYATAIIDQRGRALFADDIYRRDDRLSAAMGLH